MEGFEGMPKQDSGVGGEEAARASRAPLGLTGKNANPQTLRTFQSDLADTIKSGEASLVKIAMAENERKEREKELVDPASRKNMLYIFGGLAIILIAFGIIFYVLYQKIPKIVPVAEQPESLSSIIHTDTVSGLNITGFTRDNIKAQIGAKYFNATPTINTIERILPFTQETGSSTEHILTTQEFFQTIESSMPGSLLRSLDPDFTLGVFAFNGNGLFIALKTNAYTNALAGMLAWENSMFDELYPIFSIQTTGDNAGLFSAQFKDRIIKNQDARALLNAKGEPVLFYTFIGEDKQTLVIADKVQTLEEILNRLTANTLRH